MKNKKMYIYGAVALAVIGGVGYFVFSESDQEKAENKGGTTPPPLKLESGVKVNVDTSTAYGKEFKRWVDDDKNTRLQLVTNLLNAFNEKFNNQKVMDLLTVGIPDNEYMKVFQRTFHWHTLKDKNFFAKVIPALKYLMNDKDVLLDLTGWIKYRMSKENKEALFSRYPVLQTHLTK